MEMVHAMDQPEWVWAMAIGWAQYLHPRFRSRQLPVQQQRRQGLKQRCGDDALRKWTRLET
jgi:hypothetical protein